VTFFFQIYVSLYIFFPYCFSEYNIEDVVMFFKSIPEWKEIKIADKPDASGGGIIKSIGSILKFPDNVKPLGIPRELPSMYIRECYPELLKVIKERIKTGLTGAIVILGTPGIGKFNYTLNMCYIIQYTYVI
jgi:hypothetical protein